ncbi:LapD/MoxY N-terminal periplasmic domain-containing protein [Pseudogulbenkiania sp. MAI-1]|uniref:bifunctional diguanylate cyclase/phosphodiesterase n=1 Tax=Pseudogulbenkiania sp. MAI-1 TaxID=990370 RepID=UPI00045EA4EC|nr:LapD/MoxY N-terminal periplasmic domain-containing protein [Pseudogulbenkiania sp. MAI-1]
MTKLSLVQRLWLLLLMLAFLSIGGALVANLLNARSYLEQQLTAQNADTANALALMLTQYKAEPVMAETLINAAFDQGHFVQIRWEDTAGRPKVARKNIDGLEDTPGWFHRLLPLAPAPGRALVNSGWLQAGRVVVISHPGYAYSSLWLGAVQTVLWLLATGLLAGLLGFLDIRSLRRQLGTVVDQAHAISEQRFLRIAIPSIPELADVAHAMNTMVERLQSYLLGLKDELERLRKEKLTDPTTGLPNRDAFDQRLTALLGDADEPVSGYLLLIRVAGLAELNQRLGGRKADALLRRLADDLKQHGQRTPGGLAARLRGADFALLCPELSEREALQLANELCAQWPLYQAMDLTDTMGVGHIGVTAFSTGDSLTQVLGRASDVLAQAEAQVPNTWKREETTVFTPTQASDLNWRQLIESACRDQQLALRWYPVRSADHHILWHEGMLYRPEIADTPPMSALRLVSHALRLGLTHLLDLAALTIALERGPAGALAVNFSPASLGHDAFLGQVQQLLKQHPERKVTFEFHETGLNEYWEPFLAFSRSLRAAGQRIAVEIQGHDLELVARIHEAGIAYLVLDNALTRNIHQDEGRQALLRGLLQMTSLMGVQLEAKGIASHDEARTLIELGVHSLTGPAIA